MKPSAAKFARRRVVIVHTALHFIVPFIVAIVCYRPTWRRAYLLLIAGIAIDIDHLWATPIYDPTRCSIGFHPLHGAVPIGIYLLLFAIPKTRIIGLGLLLHILLDVVDCIVIANA